jgi:hypothetical protein
MNSELFRIGGGIGETAQAVMCAIVVVVIAYIAYNYYMSQGFSSNPYVGTFDGMTPIPVFKSIFLPPNPYWA